MYSVTYLLAKGAQPRPVGRYGLTVMRRLAEPEAPAPPFVADPISALRDMIGLIDTKAASTVEHVRAESNRAIEREREYNRLF